jgi:hypothetical protein
MPRILTTLDHSNAASWEEASSILSAGPTGPAGAQGSAGPTGAQGSAGPAGAQGAQGSAGPAGAQGSAGPAGAQGSSGPTGAQGSAGPTGAQGAEGPIGPTGPSGTAGLVRGRSSLSAVTFIDVSTEAVTPTNTILLTVEDNSTVDVSAWVYSRDAGVGFRAQFNRGVTGILNWLIVG